jgi:predicted nuclease of predicted toxin-antitoxin system
MKILLDENIDIRFKDRFNKTEHEIFTVREMNWTGIKNGELIKLLKENNFNCWIVVDKNIPYQQNISNLSFILVVLDVYRNTLPHLISLLPKILLALNSATLSNKLIIIKEE